VRFYVNENAIFKNVVKRLMKSWFGLWNCVRTPYMLFENIIYFFHVFKLLFFLSVKCNFSPCDFGFWKIALWVLKTN